MRIDRTTPNCSMYSVYLNGERVKFVQAADSDEGWVDGYFPMPGVQGLHLIRKTGLVRILYEGNLLVVR